MTCKMNFLVHTDFGHDADDCFALTYLIEHGYLPETISITPGFSKQSNILTGFWASFPIELTGFHIPIYEKSRHDITKEKENNFNCRKYDIFNLNFRYVFFPIEEKYYDKALIIGPPKNLGYKLSCKEMFFQGGYSPNSINPLEKFKGLEAVPSYNPNGAKEDFNQLLNSQDIEKKYYIGKNVCHGFTKEVLQRIWEPKNQLVRKFWDLMEPTKAMHDVLAAILFINKDLGIWSQEKPKWVKGKLTTEPTNEEVYTLIGLKI